MLHNSLATWREVDIILCWYFAIYLFTILYIILLRLILFFLVFSDISALQVSKREGVLKDDYYMLIDDELFKLFWLLREFGLFRMDRVGLSAPSISESYDDEIEDDDDEFKNSLILSLSLFWTVT